MAQLDLVAGNWLKDEHVFELVFRSYYEQLCFFAMRYVGEEAIAEEMVQDTFASVWRKSSQIDVRTTPKSYLYGSVRNNCLNYIKHQKVKQAYLEYSSMTVNSPVQDFLELDELQAKIDGALDCLPTKCREVFELSRFEGKKYKEIADELGISIKTVEHQMGKALKVMRDQLKEYLPILCLILPEWFS